MRYRSGLIFACLLLAIVACTSADRGGDARTGTVTLSGDATCAACSIVVESLAFLPHPHDSLVFLSWALPERDSRGRYYAVDGANGLAVHVFGADGRIMQSFGRGGSGPGEFTGIYDIEIGLADSLFFFQFGRGGRVLVFTPSYQFARDFAIASEGTPNAFAPLSDGRFVIASSPNRFSILSHDGRLDSASERGAAEQAAARGVSNRTRRTSPPVAVGIPLAGADTMTCRQCGIRTFTGAVDAGTIWSASMHQYVIEQHDLSGKLVRRIVRDVPWYPRWPAEAAGDGHGAAMTNELMMKEVTKSRLMAMYQAGDTLLWTFVVVQDPANPVPAGMDFMKEMEGGDGNTFEKYFTTRVEAIDPNRGEVLAGIRLKGQVYPVRGGLVIQSLPNEVSGRTFKVLRLQVAGR